jgi:hypothetical protein
MMGRHFRIGRLAAVAVVITALTYAASPVASVVVTLEGGVAMANDQARALFDAVQYLRPGPPARPW